MVKELVRKRRKRWKGGNGGKGGGTRLIKGVAGRQREWKRDQRHLTGTEPRNGGGSIRSIGVTGHLRVYRRAAARRVSLNNEHLADSDSVQSPCYRGLRTSNPTNLRQIDVK